MGELCPEPPQDIRKKIDLPDEATKINPIDYRPNMPSDWHKKKAKPPGPQESPSVTIWKQTSGRCVYCGVVVEVGLRSADHVVPKSKGGKRTLNNLIPACKPCNSRRGIHWPPSQLAHPDFIIYVKAKEDSTPMPPHPSWKEPPQRIIHQPPPKTAIKPRSARIEEKKVVTFFEGGYVASSPEGFHVFLGKERVTTISWADVRHAFGLHFIYDKLT